MKLIVIFTCFLFASSCSLFDSFDDVPMYLTFSDEVTLTTRADEGANTQDIFAVSVFADGFNIGVFELPADVPVLDDDNETNISVFAVVRNNGQGDNAVPYLFYEPIEFTSTFSPGEFIPVDLDFSYIEDLSFLYIEDFEGQHTIVQNIDEDENIIIEQSADALTGAFSGSITTSEDHPFFEKSTLNTFLVEDLNNTFGYMEVDYRSDVPFRLGILGIAGIQADRVYKIQLNPSEEWNKLYLDLTDEILANNFTAFKLLFSNLTGETDFGTVEFDNIKLVTF